VEERGNFFGSIFFSSIATTFATNILQISIAKFQIDFLRINYLDFVCKVLNGLDVGLTLLFRE
jgi:hypothetical protein